MNELTGLLEKFGWPSAILIIFAAGVWRFAKYVGVKLFDDEKGYVPKVVTAHVEFLSKTEEVLDGMKDLQEKVLENQGKIIETAENSSVMLTQMVEKTPVVMDTLKRIEKSIEVSCTFVPPPKRKR